MTTLSELNKAVKAYEKAKASADAAKAKADAAKAALLDLAGKYTELGDGTNNIDLGASRLLKIVRGTDYKVDAEAMQTVTLPEEIGKALIHWKPELNVRVFKVLSPEHMLAVSAFVTSKPIAPTVKIEEKDTKA